MAVMEVITTMKIIRSREYYDQLNELMEADQRAVDYHIKQALK